MFIDVLDDGGGVVNLAHVQSFKRFKPHGEYADSFRTVEYCVFDMAGGARVSGHVLVRDVDVMEMNSGVVIPATPGYQVVLFGVDDGKAWIDQQPIIAWKVAPERAAPRPISPVDSDLDDEDNWAVLYPDGRVGDWWHGAFPAIEQWFEFKCGEANLAKTGEQS